MTTALPDDPTLEEIRSFVAPDLAQQAAFDGWTIKAVAAAAEQAGVDPDVAALAFSGPVDIIDAWFQSVDDRMAAAWPQDKLAELKIRERIRTLVAARLEIMRDERESLRRALSVLAMPHNAGRAAQLGWRAADRMWRLAGDTATDYNHYTKRMTLSAVYGSTIAVFLNDDSDDLAKTHEFLDRRIDNIMQFEKWKSRLLSPDRDRFSPARFFGRLRYRGN